MPSNQLTPEEMGEMNPDSQVFSTKEDIIKNDPPPKEADPHGAVGPVDAAQVEADFLAAAKRAGDTPESRAILNRYGNADDIYGKVPQPLNSQASIEDFDEPQTMDEPLKFRRSNWLEEDQNWVADMGTRVRQHELEVAQALEVQQKANDQKWRDRVIPSALDQSSAALKLYHPVASWIARGDMPNVPDVEGYNVYKENLDGYTDFLSAFKNSGSPEETSAIKRNIDMENGNREILQQGNWIGTASSIAAGVVDPINLAFLLLPGAGVAKTGSIARTAINNIAAGAVVTALSEGTLHATQDTRTAEETAFNFMASSLLDGVLGGMVAKYSAEGVGNRLIQRTLRDAELEVNANVRGQEHPRSAGAQEADGTSFETSSTGGKISEDGFLNKYLKYTGIPWVMRQSIKASPVGRTSQSSEIEVRALQQSLVDTPWKIQGDYVEQSLESVIQLDNAVVAQLTQRGAAHQRDSGLEEADFNHQLSIALKSGDKADNASVEAAAKEARTEVFEKFLNLGFENRVSGFYRTTGSQVGGDLEYHKIETQTAASYFTRLYNTDAVRKNQAGARQAIEKGQLQRIQDENSELYSRISELETKSKADLKMSEAEYKKTSADEPELRYEHSQLGKDNQQISGQIRKIEQAEGRLAQDKATVSEMEVQIKDTTVPTKLKTTLRKQAKEAKARIKKEEKWLADNPSRKTLDASIAKNKARRKDIDDNTKKLKEANAQHKAIKSKIREMEKQIQDIPDHDELYSFSQEYIRSILNLRPGDIAGDVGNTIANSTKRRIPIRDEFLTDFLVNDDPYRIITQYSASVGPKVRTAQKFGEGTGDTKMSSQIASFREKFISRIERATEQGDHKEANKLKKEMTSSTDDMVAMLERIQNMRRPSNFADPANKNIATSIRTLKNLNTATMSGGFGVNSLPDIGRVIAYDGAINWVKANARAIKSFTKSIKSLPKDRQDQLLQALTRTGMSRQHVMADLDTTPLSKTEAMAQYVADKTIGFSGILHLDAYNRSMIGHLSNNKITKTLMDGDTKGFSDLKALGFDEFEIKALQAEVKKHGVVESDGFKNMNADKWDDAGLTEKMDIALLQEANRVVVNPGAGDMPLMADNELGSMFFQFKKFMYSSQNRVAMSMMQKDAAELYSAFLYPTVIGAMIYPLREIMSGRIPDSNPIVIGQNAIQMAGYLGYMEMYVTMSLDALGVDITGLSKYKSRSSAGNLIGPSAGTVENIFKAINNNNSTDARLHALRRLMPFQSHFLLRRIIDQAEAGVAKVSGGTGRYGTPEAAGTPPTL